MLQPPSALIAAEGRRPKAPGVPGRLEHVPSSQGSRTRGPQPLETSDLLGRMAKGGFGGPPQRVCFSLEMESSHLYVK